MSSSPLSIRAAAREHGDALALVDGDHRTTYRELAAEVAVRAAQLAQRGAGPGAFVAVVGEPTRARVIDVLAAIELGTPLSMIHPRWTDRERQALRDDTQPVVELPSEALAPPPSDADHLREAERRLDARTPIDDAAPLALLYTSGTTGRAKGAILSRRAFLASARASATNLPLAPGDRWLLAMPLAHVGGLSIVVRSLVARSTIVLGGAFHQDRTRDEIARTQPTLLSLVPTMLARLLDVGFTPPPSLRAILLGGAACPEAVLRRALDAGLPVRTTYGLTEACSQVTTARENLTTLDAGSGEPLPGTEVRIGPGGAIAVRGPTLFDGWFPPGAHPHPFDADGFYETGDLGHLDARGRLHVLSRRSDLIVSGGENVYPVEVENALEQLPGVRAACVFGVPDDEWGQVVAAALVTAPEAPDDAALLDALTASLSRFKRPRRIARVPELALNGAGKVDRLRTAALAAPLLRPVEARRA